MRCVPNILVTVRGKIWCGASMEVAECQSAEEMARFLLEHDVLHA